jgi:hypothetical protein
MFGFEGKEWLVFGYIKYEIEYLLDKIKQAVGRNVLQYVIFSFVGVLDPRYILEDSYTFIRQNL